MEHDQILTMSAHQGPVAVLVDGENTGAGFAPDVLRHLRGLGPLSVRRVYGDAARTTAWEREAGFRPVHSGAAKNAADMALVVDAMTLCHQGGIRQFVLVTSDGDFSHLAHALRELGHLVIGIGMASAPGRFRRACSRFFEIGTPKAAEPVTLPILPATLPAKAIVAVPVPLPAGRDDLERCVIEILREQPVKNGVEIQALNSLVCRKGTFQIKATAEKNWRGWLAARPLLFQVDPKGAASRVRLRHA